MAKDTFQPCLEPQHRPISLVRKITFRLLGPIFTFVAVHAVVIYFRLFLPTIRQKYEKSKKEK